MLGDGGVGKTALAVQVSSRRFAQQRRLSDPRVRLQFTLNCFVGESKSHTSPRSMY